jgi:hypothetical protein
MASNHEDWTVREASVTRLSNPSLLSQIALNDLTHAVRLAATDRLKHLLAAENRNWHHNDGRFIFGRIAKFGFLSNGIKYIDLDVQGRLFKGYPVRNLALEDQKLLEPVFVAAVGDELHGK